MKKMDEVKCGDCGGKFVLPDFDEIKHIPYDIGEANFILKCTKCKKFFTFPKSAFEEFTENFDDGE